MAMARRSVIGDQPAIPTSTWFPFTGSTRAGVLVAQAAAPTVKRVCQELGGKSANIILPDADLARRSPAGTFPRGCSNTGQSCHSPTRILVHESQVEDVLKALLEAEAAKVRSAIRRTRRRPWVRSSTRHSSSGSRLTSRSGIDEGARVVCGGPAARLELERGYFVQPTVFADVRPT